ncbi:hypothetical protein FACS1894216_01100 [Synergistales bacterium]|nr:hypothetical protein FACS1894216_01100 [Synergistales bacterium]
MGARTYYKGIDTGYPGALSRVHEGGYTIESKKVAEGTAAALFNGSPAALNADGNIVPAETAALAGKVIGFVVRPYPSQGVGSVTGEDEPWQVNSVASVMRRGYMTALVEAGTAAARGQVYVITGGNDDSLLGAISAVATNATAITGAFFTGAADTRGIAEIEFNI